MNAFTLHPVHQDAETVTLHRADYEALLEALEDAQDLVESREALARLQRGEEEAFPIELVEQIIDGMQPVRAFRQYRGLTQQALAQSAGVSASYLCEIEAGRKTGSLDAITRIAGALRLPIDSLLPPKRAE
ncbi:helix-turn-helix transcriptional regulator [Niveispirillum sp.]|uniref:helix-turn-helix domain-containing protein n=1 Tax=Niveispirillum sp. TaxID=1917217 RepID=UPI001B412D55|nr:helix-turn-helix transcriptional regulator [Niveispirillum sp.]MBP7335027.1 helix-turn-helix transcriptional regulator [Niveispirillum sp.]